jgi:hypothetical protein
MTAQRFILPPRRAHWLLDFEHAGFRYTGGVGRDDDSPAGDLTEIFLDCTGKAGTALGASARDAAVTASLLLQFGCPIDTLRHALARDGSGAAAGPLGRLLDILESERPDDV